MKYAFGPYIFDEGRRILRRAGQALPLSNKAVELLALLVSEAGKPVSKERIYRTVWADALVEDSNITQTVYVLRKVLSDTSAAEPMIRTIPKLGYQFVEPVREISSILFEPYDVTMRSA